MDSEKNWELTGEDMQSYKSDVEQQNLQSSSLSLRKRDFAFSEAANNCSYSSKKKSENKLSLPLNPAIDFEKSPNGSGKVFPRSKN